MADDRQGLADHAEVGQKFFGQRGVRSERGLPLRVQILRGGGQLGRAEDQAQVVQERGKVDRVDILGRQNAEFFAEMRAGVGHPFAVLPQVGVFFLDHGKQGLHHFHDEFP